LIQGLSVGGEFSSSVTYLVETARDDERGQSGSWANVGSMLGMLIGSGLAAAATNFLDDQTLHDWGWRLPFLFGAVLGCIGILLSRHLPKSKHFKQHEVDHGKSSPLRLAFTRNRRETIQGLLFASGYGAVFYITLVYLPNWLHDYAGMDLGEAMRINTAATAMMVVLIPVAGWFSDHYVRRTRLMSAAFAAMALICVPLFWWIRDGDVLASVSVQFVLAALIAIPCGVAPATFVELFPTEDRLSGYSVAFNIGLGVVGGSTPMVATWLIETTGNSLAPAGYLIALAIVGIVGLAWMQDRSREPLR
ncbi:MAG: MFS transporter, partial [Pseudomonadales bacterium]|nr:MFS transporter [Pseudomonadales bacterium]